MKARVLGWLLLLGALSIPAFLIWNWWVKQQTKSTYQVQLKAPQGGAFGDVRSQQGGLPNPIQGGTTAAASAPVQQAAAAQAQKAQTQGGSVANAAEPARTQAPEASEVRTASRARSDPSGRQTIIFNPKTKRDPTLSVIDEKYLALKMEEREAARRAKTQKFKPRPKPKVDVRRKLNVQGIIALPTGNSAIVNDEVRKRGDKIHGCVIRRITSKRVVFKCPGYRPFSKSVEQ